MPPSGVRLKLQKLMAATLADEQAHHDWTYHAVRPLPVPPSWKPGQHVTGDCSKGVQMLAKWAAAPDPMGNNFGVYGNSQTICLHLQHLAQPSELAVGDIVTFGPNGRDHAAMVLKAGADPLLWSFGHQGAPNSYRLSADTRVHQLLRLPAPAYVPTAEDKLRAETGYWAWVQWRLGEGDWFHYAPATATVRPNVPKLIPPAWWVAYLQFLANRKKGNPPTTEPRSPYAAF